MDGALDFLVKFIGGGLLASVLLLAGSRMGDGVGLDSDGGDGDGGGGDGGGD